MKLVNEKNNQFIQTRVNSKQGVTCSNNSFLPGRKHRGGGYGATAESLAHSATNSMGKGYVAPTVYYNSCDKQSGGGHNYDADVEGFSYGYTKEGAGVASELKGSYAPISVNKKTNMCGGKKKRKSKKKRRRRKNKTRKSRRKRRTKRRRKRRRKSRGGKRRTKRGGACSKFKKLSRRQRGGMYKQFGSNVAVTPSYTSPFPSALPWATGPLSHARQINCQDNYNHFKK